MDDRNYCKTCNAAMRFIYMTSGISMPVNYDSVVIIQGEGKNAYVTRDGRVVKGRPRQPGERLSGLRRVYVAHFATCPDADKHRKRSLHNEMNSHKKR